jgi:phosphatidylinositol-3-phosphatase
MFHSRFQRTVCALALAGAVGCGSFAVRAEDRDRDDNDHQIKTVFVIAMENHNWTQPGSQTSPQQIFQNPAAPFINSLVNGTSGISSQVAFANAYINAAVGDHPSEPNYIWAEAGTNFGVASDVDPYNKTTCAPQTVQTTNQHLSAFLTVARKDWKSYQEDTDIDTTSNTVLPQSAWTVPLFSQSGSFTAAPASNEYNYTKQFNYATKHNPMAFFTDTNGGCNPSPTNPLREHYAPLQQLALDLADDKVADYNWITPDQYNDQHSTLANGYGQYPNSGTTADSAEIAQGDNFLARVVPLIMSSRAYQDHGVIVLWWDESEGGDDAGRTLPFIVISRDAHKNVNGVPYSNTIQYSHSSFVRTMQEIFDVTPRRGFNWLGAAASATDLSDLFQRDAIR